ncbi:MAG: Nif3-like dinuclear metal center hexameric protein [Coriobacteriales bacterium]|jgi:putative NIF3 family GTP cyclohydrolase 1 type 2
MRNTVGDLESYLFDLFPREHCEPWDLCGLSVGDARAEVTGVAIALDPYVATIEEAAAQGCNVLLTHHPVYIEPPARFVNRGHGGTDAAARVVAALRNGVALIAMHTNLDRSTVAKEALLATVGLDYAGELFPTPDGLPSFGCLGTPAGGSISLDDLAAVCGESYGVTPRVWGSMTAELEEVAIVNGSSSSLVDDIVDSGVDCAITGEMSFHRAGELASSGICIIELGHDVSEFPMLGCLKQAVEASDGFCDRVRMLGPDIYWWQPRMVGK